MSPVEAKYREGRLLIVASCYIFTVVAVIILSV